MTFLNNVPAITKRHHITAHPSSTLSAIANAVSAKAKLSSSDRRNDYQMPIHRNKGNPNIPLLIPTTILPSKTADDMTNTHTSKLCIPITVRITNPNPSRNSKFDHSRILEALLQAFRHVDLESNIRPTPTSPHHMNREKNLYNVSQVKNLNDETTEYLEFNTETENEHFCARILLNTDNDLIYYKRNTVFVQWLKTEQIQLDRNPLKNTLKPRQIGFFSHMMPRSDLTDIYEHELTLPCRNLALHSSYKLNTSRRRSVPPKSGTYTPTTKTWTTSYVN
jgi:hypothetical protein